MSIIIAALIVGALVVGTIIILDRRLIADAKRSARSPVIRVDSPRPWRGPMYARTSQHRRDNIVLGMAGQLGLDPFIPSAADCLYPGFSTPPPHSQHTCACTFCGALVAKQAVTSESFCPDCGERIIDNSFEEYRQYLQDRIRNILQNTFLPGGHNVTDVKARIEQVLNVLVMQGHIRSFRVNIRDNVTLGVQTVDVTIHPHSELVKLRTSVALSTSL